MKIVIAIDSYKGSCTSIQAAEWTREGLSRVWPDAEYHLIPVADGGEGTVDAVTSVTGGKKTQFTVTGPLGKPVKATMGRIHDQVIIEMASASGLPLIKEEMKDPLRTTTYGTGELIRIAMNQGANRIMLGLGGSATNDGGAGMAQALGFIFSDENNNPLLHPLGGGDLGRIHHINPISRDPRIDSTSFIIASDVDNPLLGKRGATATYGPQKGATEETIPILENNLSSFSKITADWKGRDDSNIAGAGAAGGMGFGLLSFCNAELKPGIDIVLDMIEFDSIIEGADLIITGEGSFDYQSLNGKVPMGVASRAGNRNIPVLVLAGSLGRNMSGVWDAGFSSAMSAVPRPMSLKEAMANPEENLSDAAEKAARMIEIGRGF